MNLVKIIIFASILVMSIFVIRGLRDLFYNKLIINEHISERQQLNKELKEQKEDKKEEFQEEGHDVPKEIERSIEQTLYTHQTTMYYPGYKKLKWNYEGKCGEVFKYKPNNERDLLILSYRNFGNLIHKNRFDK